MSEPKSLAAFKEAFWRLAAERELTCCDGRHMTGGGPDREDIDQLLEAAWSEAVDQEAG